MLSVPWYGPSLTLFFFVKFLMLLLDVSNGAKISAVLLLLPTRIESESKSSKDSCDVAFFFQPTVQR